MQQIPSLRLQREAILLTPQTQTSSLQNYETICFCCLSPSGCGTSLWQPYGRNKPPLGLKIQGKEAMSQMPSLTGAVLTEVARQGGSQAIMTPFLLPPSSLLQRLSQ